MKNKMFAVAASVSFIVFFFLSCLDYNCFNRLFYQEQYAKLDVADEIKMNYDDLMNVTEVLLDYVQDKEDSLKIVVNINGVEREVFNNKEKQHMVDVKNLYLKAMSVKNISFIIMVISLMMIYKKDYFLILANFYLKVVGVFSSIIVFLVFYLVLDFSSFWTNFHQLFFTNDLWLLDPRKDILIMMVPEPFFNQLVINITVSFLSIIILISIICYVYRKRVLKYD